MMTMCCRRSKGGAGCSALSVGSRRDAEQASSAFEVGLAPGAGEQAIVADPMKSARQSVAEEAEDELIGGEGHDLLPSGAGLDWHPARKAHGRLVPSQSSFRENMIKARYRAARLPSWLLMPK
jgi:hypothetical protein